MTPSGDLIAQEREILEVKNGDRGLRQSEALFQHINQLPGLIKKVIGSRGRELTKVIVSGRPRPQNSSYMPVFKVGLGQAQSLASILQIPLVEVSHQEGHVMAGLWSANIELSDFLAVHLSGGTTDLLKVKCKDDKSAFRIKELGTSMDLHAGQFIDRVGVALGLSFPAGPSLEELGRQGEFGKETIPSAVDGYNISFSGPATAAMRLIKSNKNPQDIALAVEQCIAKSLEKVLKKAIIAEGQQEVLIVGGVAANQYIRSRLKKRLEHPAIGAKLYFADPQWSSDNAVGIAALGLE